MISKYLDSDSLNLVPVILRSCNIVRYQRASIPPALLLVSLLFLSGLFKIGSKGFSPDRMVFFIVTSA
nr:MAG TPA: hypothetical protein [Bacteriophage sp.]